MPVRRDRSVLAQEARPPRSVFRALPAAVDPRGVPHRDCAANGRLAGVERDGDLFLHRQHGDLFTVRLIVRVLDRGADQIVGAAVLGCFGQASGEVGDNLVIGPEGSPHRPVDPQHRDMANKIEVADPDILAHDNEEAPPDAGAALPM